MSVRIRRLVPISIVSCRKQIGQGPFPNLISATRRETASVGHRLRRDQIIALPYVTEIRRPDDSNFEPDAFADHAPTAWLLFVLFPVGLAVFGVVAIIRQDMPLRRFTVAGASAVGYGIMLISAGIIMHFRGFWGRRADTWWQPAGMLVGWIGVLVGFGVVAARFVRWI